MTRASPLRPAPSWRTARPENPGAPLGTLELVVPAAEWATALVYTRARPAESFPAPGARGRAAREPLSTHVDSWRVASPPGASFRAGPAAANFLVRGVSRPSPDPGPPLSLPRALGRELGELGAAPAVRRILQPGTWFVFPAGHVGSTPHPTPSPVPRSPSRAGRAQVTNGAIGYVRFGDLPQSSESPPLSPGNRRGRGWNRM